jgi:glycosyltransferase involved in cell wall biosynthesis
MAESVSLLDGKSGNSFTSEVNKIGIVLATYNPNIEYLQKQLTSIRRQTWSDWVCYVVDDASEPAIQEQIRHLCSDDDLFQCYFHEQNLGSYYNFERGLQYCARDETIRAIAFADQDDIWQPEKLEILFQTLQTQQALLVHSDLSVIDEQDCLVHPSCWHYEGRNPQKLSPDLLLLRNCVTGCSLLFRPTLLSLVLPFPKQSRVDWHHDLWVALAAATLGKIAHVDRPLVQYRLHGSNVLGATKDAGKLHQELWVWFQKKCRITGRSYLIHRDLSQAFYQRFQTYLPPDWRNPFCDRPLDFGWRILMLGLCSVRSGYGSEGLTLRLLTLKILFDLKRIRQIWRHG